MRLVSLRIRGDIRCGRVKATWIVEAMHEELFDVLRIHHQGVMPEAAACHFFAQMV